MHSRMRIGSHCRVTVVDEPGQSDPLEERRFHGKLAQLPHAVSYLFMSTVLSILDVHRYCTVLFCGNSLLASTVLYILEYSCAA